MTDGVTAARGYYLFTLAAVCHTGPREVDEMALRDFGRLTAGLDAMEEEED